MKKNVQAVFTCFFVSPDGPNHTSVYSSPSGGIEEGSSVTLSCSSDANPAADYTWFKEHEDSVGQSGQNFTITNITSELGGSYYCQPRNAIGHHNSTFLFIRVKGNCPFKTRTHTHTHTHTYRHSQSINRPSLNISPTMGTQLIIGLFI
jgi:hypothetical protein